MPLKNPEWIAPNGSTWDGDLGLSMSRMFGFTAKGVLWDELAKITDEKVNILDDDMSVTHLPRYSYKIALAYCAASQNQGAAL